MAYFVAYPQRMAGANRCLLELVLNLPAEVSPLVICAGEGMATDAFRQAGIPCVVLPAPGILAEYGRALRPYTKRERLRAAVDLMRYTRRLRRILKPDAFDLVHTNDVRGTLLVALAAKAARLPILTHVRGEVSHGWGAMAPFDLVTDRIVTVSDGVRATLTARGRAKAVTVYDGIDRTPGPTPPIEWLEDARAAGVLVVGCFASLVPFKGHHHLLDAAALLAKRGWGRERLLFVCVGASPAEHGDWQDWLRGRCAALGLDNVVFTGWQAEPFPFYSASDVCVLPSVSSDTVEVNGRRVEIRGGEGFPHTHLEAMSMGVAVVGTRIAGVPEQVIEGVTGLLVEPGDPTALADAIEALLVDEGLRREMGAAGRRRVRECFSTHAYVQGILGEYARLCPAKWPA